MTSLHDLLVARRSIRRYTDEPLSADDVKLILEAGLLAPSSKNQRSCRFIAVEDRDLIARLAECKPSGAHPIADAMLAIVVASDSSVSTPWVEDASIAATMMQLQIEDLGLGSCWIQVRGRELADGTPSQEYIQELLGMPEQVQVLCVLSIGHKAEQRQPQNVDKLCWDHVHIDRWHPENEE